MKSSSSLRKPDVFTGSHFNNKSLSENANRARGIETRFCVGLGKIAVLKSGKNSNVST